MRNYLDLAKLVLEKGRDEPTRTGIDAKSIFGHMLEFDLRKGFPHVTSRQTGAYDVGKELFMFLGGITDNNWLKKHGCHIWDEWELPADAQTTRTIEYDARLRLLSEKLAVNRNTLANNLRGLYADARQQNPELSTYDFEQQMFKEHGIPETETVTTHRAGELGPIYGRMWRAWPTADGRYIDQIHAIDEQIAKVSKSRRLICSAWNVEYLPDESKPHAENIVNGKQVLPPCHTFFQLRVYSMTIEEIYEENDVSRSDRNLISNEMEGLYFPSVQSRRDYIIACLQPLRETLKTEYLSMIMYARSQDLPLGTPYNISSYALFLSLWANSHDMVAKDLKIMMGDVHIYSNQIELMREQIKRDPRPLPKLVIAPEAKDFLNVDITKTPIKSLYRLEGYNPHPAIRYPRPAV